MARRKSIFIKKKAFYTDPDLLAEGFLIANFIFDPGKKSLKSGDYTLRSWRDEFYKWENGQYNKVSNAEMKKLIKKHLHNLNKTVQYSQYDTDQKIRITNYMVNNILLCISGMDGVHMPESRELNSWPDCREKLFHTIAVKNGLLMLRKNGREPPYLAEHTPSYFNIIRLPYDYNSDADCPEWIEFLDEIMLGRTEYVQLLQQWFGYLLRPDLREHRFLLMVGEGANGKGVLCSVTAAFVGEENCSHVSLNSLRNQFSKYAMLGKVVNITDEASHFISDEAETNLKTLVSGDRTEFDRKYKEPVNALPTAKIMVATNAKPRFGDKTMGIWRRILYIPFDKSIPENMQNKGLAKQLKRELSGILNWAIEGLQKLNTSGFIIPKDNNSLLEEYRKESDPARAFLLDNYMMSPNRDGTLCSKVFEAYRQYCTQNNCKPMNNTTFGQQVKRVFPDVERVRLSTGNREYIYKGLVAL